MGAGELFACGILPWKVGEGLETVHMQDLLTIPGLEVLGGNGAHKVLQAFTQHIYIVNKEVLQLLVRTSARSYCLVNNEPWEQNLLTYSIRHSCALAMMMNSP